MQARTWTFLVPLTLRPPTANSRTHWAQRARDVRRLRAEVALVAQSERHRLGAPKATVRRRLELVYVRPPREAAHPLDPDQVVAAMKPVVDGLRDAFWLVDDAPRWCRYLMPDQRRGIDRAVVVVITEDAVS